MKDNDTSVVRELSHVASSINELNKFFDTILRRKINFISFAENSNTKSEDFKAIYSTIQTIYNLEKSIKKKKS